VNSTSQTEGQAGEPKLTRRNLSPCCTAIPGSDQDPLPAPPEPPPIRPGASAPYQTPFSGVQFFVGCTKEGMRPL